MSDIHCSTFSASPVDFTVFHEIMLDHIHRGNDFAVLAALALNVVHEDPHFWHTCTYRSGIAAAVIRSSLNGSGKTHPQEESGVTTDDTFISTEQEPLTASELYIMLKRISNEDKLLSRVIEQLEEVPVSPNIGEDVISSSSSRDELQIDLADLCTVLHERCRNCKVKGTRVLNVPNAVSNVHSDTIKHPRLSDDSLERRVVHVTESSSNYGKNITNTQNMGDNGDIDSVGCSDALGVLSRIPALPGSTRALKSFDAVGDFINDNKHSGRGERVNQNIREGYRSLPERNKVGNTTPLETPLKQRRHKFTPEEDEAILRGVVRFAQGPGRFESIFHAYRDVWHPCRTSTQLYDHWRGTLRQQAILQQGGYRGKNSVATRGVHNKA